MKTKAKTCTEKQLSISINIINLISYQYPSLYLPSWGKRWQLWRFWWPRAGQGSSAGLWWTGGPSSEEHVSDRWNPAGVLLASRITSGGQRTATRTEYHIMQAKKKNGSLQRLQAQMFVSSEASHCIFHNYGLKDTNWLGNFDLIESREVKPIRPTQRARAILLFWWLWIKLFVLSHFRPLCIWYD